MAIGTNGLAPTASAPGGSGGGGAPADAEYLVGAADGDLSAERVVTDTTTVAWDLATAGQAKANVPDGSLQNVKLANSSITINGNAIALGGSDTLALASADFANQGTTTTVLHGNAAGNPSFGSVVEGDIGANAVTDTKLRDSAALSVIGRSANSSGDPADIAATATSGAVLRESGSALGFGTVATAGLADGAVTYAKVQNVTDSRLLGRSSGSAGPPIEITVGSGLSLAAGALTATGGGGGFTSVAVQVINAGTTTYTPTSGMDFCIVYCQGGGGGSPAETAADAAIGGGGGGGCAIKLFTAAAIGASQAVSVGASSTGAGNDTTFGSGPTLTGSGGGVGTSTGNTSTTGVTGLGGAGGAATGGDINIPGAPGTLGIVYSTTLGTGGNGGDSFLGAGGRGGQTPTTFQNGAAGGGFGGGAGGGCVHDNTDLSAVSGAAGVIYIVEFIS